MNNSKLIIEYNTLTLEEEKDRTPDFQEKESELIKIIDDLQGIQRTKEWSSLKKKVFDGLVGSLSKEVTEEARKENPDTLKLNRLAGQLLWAEKYSDLSKLEGTFRLQLASIRHQLYGNNS